MERQYTESFNISPGIAGWTGGANGIQVSGDNTTPNTGVTANVRLWRDGNRITTIALRSGSIFPLKIRWIQAFK